MRLYFVVTNIRIYTPDLSLGDWPHIRGLSSSETRHRQTAQCGTRQMHNAHSKRYDGIDFHKIIRRVFAC